MLCLVLVPPLQKPLRQRRLHGPQHVPEASSAVGGPRLSWEACSGRVLPSQLCRLPAGPGFMHQSMAGPMQRLRNAASCSAGSSKTVVGVLGAVRTRIPRCPSECSEVAGRAGSPALRLVLEDREFLKLSPVFICIFSYRGEYRNALKTLVMRGRQVEALAWPSCDLGTPHAAPVTEFHVPTCFIT